MSGGTPAGRGPFRPPLVPLGSARPTSTHDLRPRSYIWEWELEATPAALWPLVADTDRFNRDTGLPTVTDAREPDVAMGPGRHVLKMRVAGVPIEWEETPFEWVAPSRFGLVRRYRRGPLREMRVQVELKALGADRTLLTYRVQVWPRGIVGVISVPIQVGFLSRRAFGRVYQGYAREVRLAAQAAAGEDRAFRVPIRFGTGDEVSEVGLARLRGLTERLAEQGHDRRLVDNLARLIREGDEMELARIRPYALAAEWKSDRRATLNLLLHAAREGMLDLRWEVICPLCHGTSEGADALERLPAWSVHCDSCMVDFDSDLERSVELAFVPTSGIRRVRAGDFCVAGPRTTPHVLVQQLRAPGDTREVATLLAPGRYRVRTLNGKRSATFDVIEGGDDKLTVDLESEGALGANPAAVGPGPRIALANRTDAEQLLVVELTGWGDDSATAAEVLVLQEFRDLFSREVLAAGRSAGVGTLTVLFTDLKGSTAMYQSLGDGPAFDHVVDHFRLLREAIEPERGSVVKKIGDAVMAVFTEPAGALRTVLRAHEAVSRMPRSPSLVLKAALHTGTCIAVTLNERLDYFGSTVNVAARLADLSEGDDIVMSEAVRNDPGISGILATEGITPEPFRAPIRGVDADAVLWRVRWR